MHCATSSINGILSLVVESDRKKILVKYNLSVDPSFKTPFREKNVHNITMSTTFVKCDECTHLAIKNVAKHALTTTIERIN